MHALFWVLSHKEAPNFLCMSLAFRIPVRLSSSSFHPVEASVSVVLSYFTKAHLKAWRTKPSRSTRQLHSPMITRLVCPLTFWERHHLYFVPFLGYTGMVSLNEAYLNRSCLQSLPFPLTFWPHLLPSSPDSLRSSYNGMLHLRPSRWLFPLSLWTPNWLITHLPWHLTQMSTFQTQLFWPPHLNWILPSCSTPSSLFSITVSAGPRTMPDMEEIITTWMNEWVPAAFVLIGFSAAIQHSAMPGSGWGYSCCSNISHFTKLLSADQSDMKPSRG